MCYLSAELLLGPHLANNLNNLGSYETARQAAMELGIDLEALVARATRKVRPLPVALDECDYGALLRPSSFGPAP